MLKFDYTTCSSGGSKSSYKINTTIKCYLCWYEDRFNVQCYVKWNLSLPEGPVGPSAPLPPTKQNKKP